MLAQTMAQGKTCGEDHLVAEMLKECDEPVFQCICDAFVDRFLYRAGSQHAAATWSRRLVNLIRKRAKAPMLRSFRPIAIILVLFKLHMQFLIYLTAGKLDTKNVFQFAFRKFSHTSEVTFILQQLIEKHTEWQMNLCIADADLSMAYAYMEHRVVFTSPSSPYRQPTSHRRHYPRTTGPGQHFRP